ncbi:uncharacterized protein [Drosophila kikkawai]|uniref:MADF domain-containing protein n=1 Tax=Drosophila kikkawai TaxID=30033 RepID=A0A6P4HYE3_DROKI|nr:uncharacterized protein LOC108074061 [Drosophila kikkawai]
MQGLKRPRTKHTRSFVYEEKVLLIQQVHSRPILWDIRDKRHFDGFYLKRAWESVAAALNKDFISCKTAWKSLRDSHRYYCRTTKKNGVDSEWRFASHLAFLPKDVRERARPRTTFNPVAREDSESTQDEPYEYEEAGSRLETDISCLTEDAKDLDKYLSNWTEDMYSSIGKSKEKREELSPLKEVEHQQKTAFSRPIFAYWESLLNKMSPEDSDAAEQRMTQTLWAEIAATKHNNGL